MTPVIEGKLIPVEAIDVPPDFERAPSLVEDDALKKSIENSGIQIPLVVLTKPDGRYALIDGGRRLEIAKFLDFKSVPVVIDQLPAGFDAKDHISRMRFVLDESRQDLFPSQRAYLIRQMMNSFGMSQKDIASYLGLNPGSVSNFMAIENYVPEIVKAIDTGLVTAHHARTFDGVTPEAQSRLFRAHRNDMAGMSGGAFHKLIRSKYSPAKFPAYYTSPERTIEKLKRTQKGRRSKARPTLSKDDKKRLMQSLELQETEARDLTDEIKLKTRLCTLAGPAVNAILRHPDLVADLERLHVDKDELEVFAESF